MTPTSYQKPEIRDSNDNIIQQGAFGKNTALSNATNDGWIDYVANNLEALNNNKADADAYLPLTGGTMSGTITTSHGYMLTGTGTSKQFNIGSSTPFGKGAFLVLNGCDYTADGGAFKLLAKDANGNGHELKGLVNGVLAWDNNAIALSKDVLQLSGGTMTGEIRHSNDYAISSGKPNSDGLITISGGYNQNTGAQIVLVGENFPTQGSQSAIILRPRNSSGFKEFVLRPDGTITWDSKHVAVAGDYLPSSGGTLTGILYTDNSIRATGNNHVLSLNGGSDWSKGAYLDLYGINHANAGRFAITARDGENVGVSLTGYGNGTLTWNGKHIALSDNPQGTTLGTSYTAAWTATESSANGQQLTNKIQNVPVGVYILEAKLPVFTNNDYYANISKSGASTILDGGMGRTFSQQCVTRVIKVESSTNSFWLSSGQSATCTFSYLERGGISLTRIG